MLCTSIPYAGPFSGNWQLPDNLAVCCLPMHRPSVESPEEYDGFHTVIQCYGSDLLHRVYVCGEYQWWGRLFVSLVGRESVVN